MSLCKHFCPQIRICYTHAVLNLQTVHCPYCGEAFEANVDASGGSQEYIEDCYVCCRPIVFRIEADSNGNFLSLNTRRDDD